jgi:hypothetical protein
MKNFVDQINEAYQLIVEKKTHNCATHVEHAKFGKGECIAEEHASPDEDGHVSWYTVMFEHGSEKVDTADVKILQSSHHRHMKKKKK